MFELSIKAGLCVVLNSSKPYLLLLVWEFKYKITRYRSIVACLVYTINFLCVTE